MRCAEAALLAACLAGGAATVGAQVDPAPARTAPSPSLPALPTAEQAPAGRWTAVQLREAFNAADADRNGELTRAEAQALAIRLRSFEDLDTNKDGVLARAEYEGGLR